MSIVPGTRAEQELVNVVLDAILAKSPAALKDMDKLTARVQRKLRGKVDASVVRQMLKGSGRGKPEPIEPAKRISTNSVYLMRCDKCGWQLWYETPSSRACEFEHEKPSSDHNPYRKAKVKMISCTGMMHEVPKSSAPSFGSWAQLDDRRKRILTNG